MSHMLVLCHVLGFPFVFFDAGQKHSHAIRLDFFEGRVRRLAIEAQVDERKSIVAPACHSVVDSFSRPMCPSIAQVSHFEQPCLDELFL